MGESSGVTLGRKGFSNPQDWRWDGGDVFRLRSEIYDTSAEGEFAVDDRVGEE